MSEAFARRNKARMDTNLLAEGDKIKDLFNHEGESIIPLAGEVQMEAPLVWRNRRGRESRMGKEGQQGISKRMIFWVLKMNLAALLRILWRSRI